MSTTKVKTNLEKMKASAVKHDQDGSRMRGVEKATTGRRGSVRQRKMALQQDVDKLKKTLRHEENVHRALERAFNRPLGALPRLPSYLPPSTLELVAEVAVLEEEVVRLEEQVVHVRQGLYQEAVYTSSSKRNMNNSVDLCDSSQIEDHKQKQSKLSVQDQATSTPSQIPLLPDDGRGKENLSHTISSTDRQQSTNSKAETIRTTIKRATIQRRSAEKHLNPRKLKLEGKLQDNCTEGRIPVVHDEILSGEDCPNKISECILKCLMNIFVRMSSTKSRSTLDGLGSVSILTASRSSEETCKDPYDVCSEFGKREIGTYKNLCAVEATSIIPERTTISMFLISRLKLLLAKLAVVNLKNLTHQEKLAFWINAYNSCMMNAFLEHGIPESPEMVVALMQKATINVGGHILNPLTIEHFILRLPYHSKYTFAKGCKKNEMTARSVFGLELAEPLVTFALSCGSWSSPAVQVYTAFEVDNELEITKKDYLQAAIGICKTTKMVTIPKMLDWYLLDFAKDFESLLDWICLQLPNELRKEAIQCLKRENSEPLSKFVKVIPYEFSFRYLLHK